MALSWSFTIGLGTNWKSMIPQITVFKLCQCPLSPVNEKCNSYMDDAGICCYSQTILSWKRAQDRLKVTYIQGGLLIKLFSKGMMSPNSRSSSHTKPLQVQNVVMALQCLLKQNGCGCNMLHSFIIHPLYRILLKPASSPYLLREQVVSLKEANFIRPACFRAIPLFIFMALGIPRAMTVSLRISIYIQSVLKYDW